MTINLSGSPCYLPRNEHRMLSDSLSPDVRNGAGVHVHRMRRGITVEPHPVTESYEAGGGRIVNILACIGDDLRLRVRKVRKASDDICDVVMKGNLHYASPKELPGARYTQCSSPSEPQRIVEGIGLSMVDGDMQGPTAIKVGKLANWRTADVAGDTFKRPLWPISGPWRKAVRWPKLASSCSFETEGICTPNLLRNESSVT